mmetsp:Transcript_15337/g.55212  ORF Transcript_15337/g.55212 Transcript_15337/m.55212 type:complete len:569 (-) Transcript_15337:81-1787(-)
MTSPRRRPTRRRAFRRRRVSRVASRRVALQKHRVASLSLLLRVGPHPPRRVPHRDKLLRARRMNPDARVELLLRRAALQRDAQPLHDLRGVRADHVASDDLVRVHVHDELHERLLDSPGEGNFHRRKRRRVHVARVARGDRLRLRHPHGRDRGLAEHRARNVLVVRLRRNPAHDRVLERHALHERHRGEVHPVRDVSHRVDGVDGGLGVLVDDDRALRVELDADLLQAEIRAVRVRDAAGRPHHAVGLDHARGVRLHGERPVVVLRYLQRVDAVADDDPAALEVVRDRLPHLLVEPSQREVRAVHDLHVGAQTREDARELDGDVPSADHEDAFRLLLKRERLVGGDPEVRAGDRGVPRPAAGGEEDRLRAVLGRDAVDGGDGDLVRAGDLADAFEFVHARVVEDAAVDAVQPLDLRRLRGDEPLPGERRRALAVVPPEPDGVAEFRLERGAVHEEFLRHASANDARAAQSAGGRGGYRGVRQLHEADFRARGGAHARGADAAGAAADGEDVVVVLHRFRSRRRGERAPRGAMGRVPRANDADAAEVRARRGREDWERGRAVATDRKAH